MKAVFLWIIHLISLIPSRLRLLLLKQRGASIGKGTSIGPGFEFTSTSLEGFILKRKVYIGRNAWILLIRDNTTNPEIMIGEGTQIGRNVTISAKKSIKIGEGCLFSYNVSILDHQHQYVSGKSPNMTGITGGKEVVIGDDCFIGAHSFILSGVTLGRNCVVGANSVVTKSFPDNSVICGSPAKLLKKLT